MISIRIFTLLSIALLVIQIGAAIIGHENKRTADEDKNITLSCSDDEYFRIKDAKWQYKRTSLRNLFTPNIRFAAFYWGNYLGMGRWDVAWKVRKLCKDKKKICTFVPTRDLFGDCGYKMFLQVKYDCTTSSYYSKFFLTA